MMEYFPIKSPLPASMIPTLRTIATLPDFDLRGISLPEISNENHLAFSDHLPSPARIPIEGRGLILVPQSLAEDFWNYYPLAHIIPVSDPRSCFIDTLEFLQNQGLMGFSSIFPKTPSVASSAVISDGAVIESDVAIDENVYIGSGAIIRRGSWIQSGTRIGENCVVGTTGINAYVAKDGRRRGFPHLASVIVGENTVIGAGSVLVRGILSSTRIGPRSILGNLCNIGHGVRTGADVWMSVGTLIGGHCEIGNKATFGLGCSVRDNLKIGNGANVGMGSVVTKNIGDNISVFGNPAKTMPQIKAGPLR